MKLEEAIKILRKTVKSNKEVIKEAGKNGDINVMQLTADLDNQSIAIETVLKKFETLTEERDIYKNEYDKITKALNFKEGSLNPPAEVCIERLKKVLENSVPKKKVEDKIELLENLQKEFPDNEEIRIKIISYKELLEE